MTHPRPYLFVEQVIFFNTVHVLLVLLLSLEKVGLGVVHVQGSTSETEGFMELSVFSHCGLGRGEGACNTGCEGNGEEVQRGHGESLYSDAKEGKC